MSLNYKFQDLAKFMDDVRFLLASGGGLFPGGLATKSLPEIILRVVWIVILWIFIFVLVYIVYKIIFKGYPRFPLDLLRLNFYKKVDVKSSVGDPNGLLYDSINDLSGEDMKDALLYLSKNGHNFLVGEDTKTTVFQQVKDAIIKEYSPEYNTDATKEALSDYYKYFQQISDNLGLNGQSSASKVAKLNGLYNEVFSNYVGWYTDEILAKEKMVQCVLNDGKTDDKRSEIKERKKSLENEYTALLKRIDCKRIDTTCEFAKLFVDPVFVLQCQGDNKKLIDKWLKALGYEKPRLRYRQLEREIKRDKRFLGVKLPKQKKRAKERIRWKTEEQKKLKIQMIDIQREAIAKAEQEARTMSVPNVNKATYKNIITYDTPARIAPNTSRVEADTMNTQYTVYVPCYSLYKHYYDVHRDTMFKSLDKSMSVDEIVAYIFLTDIEKIMENVEVEKQIQRSKGQGGDENDERLPYVKPTLIGKFLQIHTTIESMAGVIEGALLDTKTPMAHLQYITFPDQDTLTGSIAELVKFNKDIVPLYSDGSASGVTLKDYVRNASKLASCKYDYSYYLMEVFSYFANIDNGAHTLYDLYVFILSSTEFNRNSLITFLNLPVEQQRDVRNLEKFKVSRELLLFLRHHPIFTLVYLTDGGQGSQGSQGSRDKYIKVMQLFVSMLEDKPSMLEKARNVEKLSIEEATTITQHIEKKVLGLKKTTVCLHMIHLYFSKYRDSFHERDSITKSKISRDGFVDIYNQHNISYEFGSFFQRLFEPFKYEFIDGRIKASWKKAFYGPRFNPDLKKDKRNISYWRDFNAFWVDYMGKKMDGMIKGWWKNFKNFTKPRF
jgi:hypothetical protein